MPAQTIARRELAVLVSEAYEASEVQIIMLEATLDRHPVTAPDMATTKMLLDWAHTQAEAFYNTIMEQEGSVPRRTIAQKRFHMKLLFKETTKFIEDLESKVERLNHPYQGVASRVDAQQVSSGGKPHPKQSRK